MPDIYVYNGVLLALQRSPGDVTGIPPEGSLFSAAVWATMCKEAGSEAALIEALGVRDMREANYA
jgi:hypothetical protein